MSNARCPGDSSDPELESRRDGLGTRFLGQCLHDFQQLSGAWPNAPVVGQVAPCDAAVAVDDQGRRPCDISFEPALDVPQPVGVDDFQLRIGQQGEFDPVVVRDLSSRVHRIGADRDDLRVRGPELVEA